MELRTLQFVAEAGGGELRGGDAAATVSGVCTDSRKVQPGDLFVALKGERFDGHDYLDEVAGRGVAAVIIERTQSARAPGNCPVVLVDDTRKALGRLAARYRQDFALAMVAVAGSNGKTTTKELMASVLRQKFETLWSESSFNNDIGVPLTLLRSEASHRAAVLEIGTNHPGELAPLARMVSPQMGVITNIGREHLEFFGDLEGVACEEGVLAEVLPADGKLFLNGDDEWTDRIAARSAATCLRVGLGEGNDWRALNLQFDEAGVTFEVQAPQAEYSGGYRIQLLGRYQVMNALFAMAVGEQLGLNREEISRGLAECPPTKMRMELAKHEGVTVLNDAYNANADSMRAALQTLAELPCTGRRIAVLGDMAELGAHSDESHVEAGRLTAELGIGQLFSVGRHASLMAEGARSGGLNRVMEFPDVDAAMHAIRGLVKSGDLVLLKASRVTGLERVADVLLGRGVPGRLKSN